MASACLPIPPERFPPPYTWPEIPDPDLSPEFEFFRLEDPPPPTMLPADELFSDGKLVPLHISTTAARSITPPPEIKPPAAVRASIDAFSPRAPTCSIRWRNILRLKKLHLTKPNASNPKTTPSHSPNPGISNASRSLTSILNRVGSKAPAPKDSDTESVSTSSRLSLSSSSSSSSHDDVVPKQRRSGSGNSSGSSVLADSPRLNSSGKVVFERSSSSPGSFSGGPRYKHGRIERSYSAHVRVAPVLNVPVVCSIRGSSKFGFPLFAVGNSNNNNNNNNNRMPRRNSKNGGIRTEQP